MIARLATVALGALLVASPIRARAQPPVQRLNPIIDLLEQKRPIFGLGFPSARGGGSRVQGGANAAGRGGAATGAAAAAAAGSAAGAADASGRASAGAASSSPAPRTALDRAKEVLAFGKADALFTSEMERSMASLPSFAEFAAALTEAGSVVRTPYPRLAVALAPKTLVIQRSAATINEAISQQLNTGVSVAVFPHVESAADLQRGIAAMRFASKGGTRPDDVGSAPAHWGMSEAEYRERADVWPLNPRGELVAWAIIESEAGLANLEEIAAVPGLSALIVGAGTLSGAFRSAGNQAGFEPAVQKILATCKARGLACGYPTNNESEVEARWKEGFAIHILQRWGEAAFLAVEHGRRLGGR